MPVVSILMPNFNCDKYIGAAISSVLSQTFTNFELLIIDNGSTDSSLSQIAKFEDRRIKLLRCERRGARFALNMGIEESKGDYIARIDADDIYHPLKVEKQVIQLKERPEFGVCYTDGWVMNDSGISTGSIRSRSIIGSSPEFDRGEVFKLLLKTDFLIGASLMARKDLLRKENFDESLHVADDWSLALRLAKMTRFKCIEEPLYGYRYRRQMTSSFSNMLANSYNLTAAMVKWMRTIDMSRDEKLRLLETLALGPSKMVYTVIRRRRGEI